MLKRKCEAEIINWIQHPATALLVNGARQVGKTWLIRECLRKMNCDTIEVNLIREPSLIPVFEQSNTVDDLIFNLTTIKKVRFTRGQTFLFVDEIQEAKDVVTKLKFWVEEGSCRFLVSGSLLGVELRSLRSAPVGYLTEIQMFPMDFEEFLLASSVLPLTISRLRMHFESREPLPEAVHQTIMQHFRRYLVVGGMPAAVQEYVSSGDMNQVTRIQQNIIELYKLDFTKYETQEK